MQLTPNHIMLHVQPLYLFIKKDRDPTFLFYIFVLLYVLHVISENKRKIISTTYDILHFSRMLPIIICLRRWEKTCLYHGSGS